LDSIALNVSKREDIVFTLRNAVNINVGNYKPFDLHAVLLIGGNTSQLKCVT